MFPAGTDPMSEVGSMPAVAPSVFTEVSMPTPPTYSSGFPRWWPNSCGARPGRVSPRLQAPALDRPLLTPMMMVCPLRVATAVNVTEMRTEYRQHFWSVLEQPSRRRSNLLVQAPFVLVVQVGRVLLATDCWAAP